MKLSALLSRAKGRDFYDALFLLSLTKPNYDYLSQKQGIHDLPELKTRLIETIEKIDLQHKSNDFEHLLFNRKNRNKTLNFIEFVEKTELKNNKKHLPFYYFFSIFAVELRNRHKRFSVSGGVGSRKV